jgi:hypothetical protein
MPLLDHFHPPLSTQWHWESFHTTWATAIADVLNDDLLPEGYFAEEQLHPAARVEIDVATFEERGTAEPAGGVAVARSKVYSPPEPTWVMPLSLIEGLELLVYSSEGGPTLVAAVELISPANKDRPESRRALATKCASYLHQGIGLIHVDVVTSRSAHLHNELMSLLTPDRGTSSGETTQHLPQGSSLYAVAYRPIRRESTDDLEIWPTALSVGEPLPELPLWIAPNLAVPVDLETTYQNACRRRRLLA